MLPMIRILLFLIAAASAFVGSAAIAAESKPNFVIIFTDDQGYGDLSCFGSTKIKTPHIDRMAEEGRKFTNFMVASPVCTPSRAALLTGCYPKRIGMHQGVLFPASTKGLNAEEHTIADHLSGQGYATACFGKWHLGHHPETLPQQHGFDTYWGIPYSNDMNHPDNKGKPRVSSDELWKDQESTLTLWNTPLMENEKIVELPVDQRTVTRRFTIRRLNLSRKTRRARSSSTCRTRCPTFLSMFRTMFTIRIRRTPTPIPLNTLMQKSDGLSTEFASWAFRKTPT